MDKNISPELTIGQVAKRTDLTPKAIRLYEARALIGPARRTAGGYRTYSQRDIAVLHFIHRAKNLGLRLEEIKQIIDLESNGTQPCHKVLQLVGTHIRDIDRAIMELRLLRKTLVQVRDAATASDRRGESAVVCRIIEGALDGRKQELGSVYTSKKAR